MAETKIEWADYTWNPIRARDRVTGKVGHYCEMVSTGCANCYSSAFQPRFGLPEFTGEGKRRLLPMADGVQPVSERVEVFLDEAVLRKPLSWKKPRRVFVCSMTDLFGAWVPDHWLDRAFAVMALTPRHTYQVLTKRPERALAWFQTVKDYDNFEEELARTRLAWRQDGNWDVSHTWPLPSVWLGVSVEDQQRADERIPLLLQVPAARRFLSCEPLLGPVNLGLVRIWCRACNTFHCDVCMNEHHPCFKGEAFTGDMLDWCVVGGESGPHARPCHVEWVRDLVRQCREASVAVFVKQLGANIRGLTDRNGLDHDAVARVLGSTYRLRDPKGGDPAEWPDDLRVREFPNFGG